MAQKVRIVFLGTNGWYDTEAGNTVSALMETKGYYIILDAGFGFHKVGAYIKEAKPIYLFLSHLHLDHIIGLHTLPLLAHLPGVEIYTPRGTAEPLKRFLDMPYTTPFSLLSKKVCIHELDGTPSFNFGLTTRPLLHSVPCTGFRFEVDGKRIAYCTDTGACDGLRELAVGADLLITECAFRSGETGGDKPFHLNPELAATVARSAGAKRLVLTHFDPGRYPSLASRAGAEKSARAVFEDSVSVHDGHEVTL